MPRLFIALDLPPGPRETLCALCTEIPNARWVTAGQLHLTLRFLGAVADDRLSELQENLARVAAPTFHTGLAGVGVFPPVPTRRKPARVLWAGLAPAEPVRALKEAIDAVLGPDPESAGHGFSPHVTLARFKEPPPPDPLALFLEQHRALHCEPFLVQSFQLYESRTLPTGPVYTVRASYPLRIAD
jgi:RNA 2',3'-cyclic 3'-phosphodiesterase